MYYVYLLRSIPAPNQTYIGFTENLKSRLPERPRPVLSFVYIYRQAWARIISLDPI